MEQPKRCERDPLAGPAGALEDEWAHPAGRPAPTSIPGRGAGSRTRYVAPRAAGYRRRSRTWGARANALEAQVSSAGSRSGARHLGAVVDPIGGRGIPSRRLDRVGPSRPSGTVGMPREPPEPALDACGTRANRRGVQRSIDHAFGPAPNPSGAPAPRERRRQGRATRASRLPPRKGAPVSPPHRTRSALKITATSRPS